MQPTSTLSRLMRLLDDGEISETTYSFAAQRLLEGESIDLSALPRTVPPEAPTGVYIKPTGEPGTGVWSKPEIEDENTGVYRRGSARPGRVRRPPRTVQGHPKAAHDDALAMRRFGALRTRRAASVSSEFGASRGKTEHGGAPAVRFAPPILELPSADSDVVDLSGMYMIEDSDAFESWAFEKTTRIDLETLKKKRAARASFANPIAPPVSQTSAGDIVYAQSVNYDEEIYGVDEFTGAYEVEVDDPGPAEHERGDGEVFAQSANYAAEVYGDGGDSSTASVLDDLMRAQPGAANLTLPLSGLAAGGVRQPPPPPVRPANQLALSDEYPVFNATLGAAAALPPVRQPVRKPVRKPVAKPPRKRHTGPVLELRDLLPEDKFQSGHGAPLSTGKTRRPTRADAPRVVTADAISRAQPAPRQRLAASGGGTAFEQGGQMSERDKLLWAIVLVLVVVLVTLLVIYATMIS